MSMTTIIDVIAAGARKAFGMSAVVAEYHARAIVLGASEDGHAGAEYYLPSLHTLTRAQRNEAIRHEFNGQNLKHICKKYGIGKSMVYEIVRRGS